MSQLCIQHCSLSLFFNTASPPLSSSSSAGEGHATDGAPQGPTLLPDQTDLHQKQLHIPGIQLYHDKTTPLHRDNMQFVDSL